MQTDADRGSIASGVIRHVLASGSLACTCGATWSFSHMPADAADRVTDVWRTQHSGPGHEPCDRATARRVRAHAERAERRRNRAG
jgi:hypothetical protein